MEKLKKIFLSGKECLPIVEGGKGIGVSNYKTAGNFAKCGAVGTISGVNPVYIDENKNEIPLLVTAKNRLDRHKQMIQHSIKAIISQVKEAIKISEGNGRIHLNVMWEMGGTETILENVLDKVKGLLHGVVCGAGMPYKLAEICAKNKVYYYPIVSSMRAFKALWLRNYSKYREWLGGVVYECPWRAGGHNGLSNNEDPFQPQDSYPRVKELRSFMNSVDLNETPIILAGGVWNIKEYEDWLDNPEIGSIAFQFGTRPLLTQESPISDYWKNLLFFLKREDIKTNYFSPTGFYSSAINTEFLQSMYDRLTREIPYKTEKNEQFNFEIICKNDKKHFFIQEKDKSNVEKWKKLGYDEILITPDETIVFLDKNTVDEMNEDKKNCIGCLSRCKFSSWSQRDENHTTNCINDPRVYCIQHALQNAIQGINNTKALFFAGCNAYRFAIDPFYKNKFIPTISELITAILKGE